MLHEFGIWFELVNIVYERYKQYNLLALRITYVTIGITIEWS